MSLRSKVKSGYSPTLTSRGTPARAASGSLSSPTRPQCAPTSRQPCSSFLSSATRSPTSSTVLRSFPVRPSLFVPFADTHSYLASFSPTTQHEASDLPCWSEQRRHRAGLRHYSLPHSLQRPRPCHLGCRCVSQLSFVIRLLLTPRIHQSPFVSYTRVHFS